MPKAEIETTHRSARDEIALSSDYVGLIVGFGMFNGHRFDGYWRAVRIEDGRTYYEPVIARDVRNDDGTYSTVWEVA